MNLRKQLGEEPHIYNCFSSWWVSFLYKLICCLHSTSCALKLLISPFLQATYAGHILVPLLHVQVPDGKLMTELLFSTTPIVVYVRKWIFKVIFKWRKYLIIAIHDLQCSSVVVVVVIIFQHECRSHTSKCPNKLTFLNLRSPALAFGQNRETFASRSPLSWQHMHERSICQILEPETCW